MVKKYKDGWCYRFNYRDAYGTLYKPFASGFKTRREAEDAELWAKTHIDEVIAKIRAKRGENIINFAVAAENYQLSPQSTFDEVYNSYMIGCKERRLSVVTIEKKEDFYNKVKKYLPQFLTMQIGKINEFHIQPIINACKTPCVVHEMYKFLHAIFEFARKKRRDHPIIRENPVEYVNKVKYVAKKKEHRGLDFANLLLKTLKQENSKFYTPVLLALTGGITREECPLILESDLNFSEYTIPLNKALVKTKTGYIEKEQKTVNRERIYYANKQIFEELHWYKRKNNIKSDFLCCNANGSLMKIKTIDSGFRKFINEHNLPHCTFHQLRTILGDGQNALGFDIQTTAETLGHGDIRVTAKHYRTVNPEVIRDATVKVFDNIIKTKKDII